VRFAARWSHAPSAACSVTLVLQGRVEYVLLRYASRALYGQLLQAGVEIHEHSRGFLHAKVAVIDRAGRRSARRTSIRSA
jgi:cardiolipin synthase